jgi:glycosyltransferase involved in cell wall biosynthesis
MASGLAVVAFDHAAAGDIIRTGVNGMLADPHSEASFVMAAQSLLNAPENMRAMGLRAAATAASMGWPSIVEATEAIMRRVVWQEELGGMPSLSDTGLAAP